MDVYVFPKAVQSRTGGKRKDESKVVGCNEMRK